MKAKEKLGFGVGLAVGLGVGLAVARAVGCGVALGVAARVGVASNVGVGATVALSAGVGDGVDPTATADACGRLGLAVGEVWTTTPPVPCRPEATAPNITSSPATITIRCLPEARRHALRSQFILFPWLQKAPSVQRMQLRPATVVKIEYVPTLHPDPLANSWVRRGQRIGVDGAHGDGVGLGHTLHADRLNH